MGHKNICLARNDMTIPVIRFFKPIVGSSMLGDQNSRSGTVGAKTADPRSTQHLFKIH